MPIGGLILNADGKLSNPSSITPQIQAAWNQAAIQAGRPLIESERARIYLQLTGAMGVTFQAGGHHWTRQELGLSPVPTAADYEAAREAGVTLPGAGNFIPAPMPAPMSAPAGSATGIITPPAPLSTSGATQMPLGTPASGASSTVLPGGLPTRRPVLLGGIGLAVLLVFIGTLVLLRRPA